MNNPTARCKNAMLLPTVIIASLWLIGCASHQATLPAPPLPPKQDSFLDAIAAIKHSIAPVVCVQTRPTGDWDLRSIEGTSFFVSADGSFITPNHVLDALTSPNRIAPCPMPAIYIPDDGVWHTERGAFRVHYARFLTQTCKRNVRLDLAYCTLVPGGLRRPNGTAITITPVEFETTTPPDGTPAAFSGFPLSNVAPISAIGFIGGYQATDDTGTVIIDRGAWPGASGSPIYLQNGHVIGIILARGTGDGIGLAYGRIARFAKDLLPAAETAPK